MSVTEQTMREAQNIEAVPNWRSWMKHLIPIGYAYCKGEVRKYYMDKRGYYWYRPVNESEMHRRT